MLVWILGATIFYFLFFSPIMGLTLFWDILIPLAPILVVVLTGFWRNICPMATNSLLPRHLGFSHRKRLSSTQIAKLNLIATIALFVIVPLRHAFFNTSGIATAILVGSIVLISFISGFFFEWKSAWCSGLCPVHPIEKLYGSKTLLTLPNAHCTLCRNCVIPCPDSTPAPNLLMATKSVYSSISGYLLVAGFPGFVWGWFHVPDSVGQINVVILAKLFGIPFAGTLATTILFWLVKKIFVKMSETQLINIFSASAVAWYYWYRIPSLFGFGYYENDGVLINLKASLPIWVIYISIISSTLFFFWWIVYRPSKDISWLKRPEFAIEKGAKAKS